MALPLVKARYVLRISASKSEEDLAGVFLKRGGTLGAAAARGPTTFSLTQSSTSESFLLTEAAKTLDLAISDALLSTSSALFSAEVSDGPRLLEGMGPHVLLSDRARLNVLSLRTGAAINGTLVSTLAGTASVPMVSLFDTVSTTGEAAAEGGVARPALAFKQIPLQYPNWDSINATLGLCQPQIVRLNEDGTESEISAVFFTPSETTARIARVQPALKNIYDAAWAMTVSAKFAPEPNLHKSVAFTRDKGLDGSGYTLAASANDTPPPLRPEAMEAVLRAAFAMELQGDHAKVLDELSVPSIAATRNHAVELATALSAISAWAKPYRVDGTPTITPTGLQMQQSEAWPMDASWWPADDCDGGAGLINQVLVQAKAVNDSGVDMQAFPNMRALANSICAHYVHGMTVLAANAGHADAADDTKAKVAGHAIITLTPKDSFAIAMQRGARATLDGKPVVDPAFESAVTYARWEALYPPELVARMPAAERPLVASHEVARKFAQNNVASKLQPFAIEPTTFASATLYKHDDHERAERQRTFLASKESLSAISPNQLRMYSSLDVGATGEHAFYSRFVEKSFSVRDNQFTSGPLRSMGAAYCHVRHVKVSPAGEIVGAGTTPKELATGDFALIPLWTVDAPTGALLDEAHDESLTNAIPMRGTEDVFDDAVYKTNMETLRSIRGFLHEEGKAELPGSVLHQGVVAFASLVGNAHALKDFERTLHRNPNITGEVYGLDEVVEGVAVNAAGEQLGRYIVLDLELPA
jgi:hypothetical protein